MLDFNSSTVNGLQSAQHRVSFNPPLTDIFHEAGSAGGKSGGVSRFVQVAALE